MAEQDLEEQEGGGEKRRRDTPLTCQAQVETGTSKLGEM